MAEGLEDAVDWFVCSWSGSALEVSRDTSKAWLGVADASLVNIVGAIFQLDWIPLGYRRIQKAEENKTDKKRMNIRLSIYGRWDYIKNGCRRTN